MIAKVLDIEGHCLKLKLANNQTVTQQITDVVNFDSHHPTKYSLDILDLPLFEDNDKVMEPEIPLLIPERRITADAEFGQFGN